MRSLIAIAAAALLASTAAHAVTVVNGSFEDGADPGLFTTLAPGDTSLGWTVLPDGIDYIGSLWVASDGVRSLDLSAATSGGVMQTVGGFVVGQRYRMTFDVSANPDGTARPRRIFFSATGGVAAMYDYANTTNTVADMMYETVTYDFIASGTSQDIAFTSGSNDAYGPVLDNVSISLIPEPATWALMLAGFAMTGTMVRRRARLASTAA